MSSRYDDKSAQTFTYEDESAITLNYNCDIDKSTKT